MNPLQIELKSTVHQLKSNVYFKVHWQTVPKTDKTLQNVTSDQVMHYLYKKYFYKFNEVVKDLGQS